MTETTATCVRGCTSWGRHLSTCEGTDEQPCRGCQPRRASHGHLCHPCHNRILEWMDTRHLHRLIYGEVHPANNIRWAMHWLELNLGAGGAPATNNTKIRHTKASSGTEPLNLARHEHIADGNAKITGWVDWLRDSRGLTSNPTTTIGRLQLLTAWLDHIEDHPEAIDAMHSELNDWMRDAHALAPWRAERRTIHGAECTDCGRRTIVRYGGEDRYTCTTCRANYDSEQYRRWEYRERETA